MKLSNRLRKTNTNNCPVYSCLICGLRADIEAEYALLKSRLERYRYTGGAPARIIVRAQPERVRRILDKRPWDKPDMMEYLLAGECFYRELLNFGGYMLHASAVSYGGRAVLFSAPCGTGKSTHAALWLEAFGARAKVLNDDKPALIASGGRVCAWGTPFSGKTDASLNEGAPVAALCFISRAETNAIKRLTYREIVASFLCNTQRKLPGAQMAALLELINTITQTVPCFALECNTHISAALLARDAIFGREE